MQNPAHLHDVLTGNRDVLRVTLLCFTYPAQLATAFHPRVVGLTSVACANGCLMATQSSRGRRLCSVGACLCCTWCLWQYLIDFWDACSSG